MPKMPPGCLPHQEICAELEQYLEPCSCGGAFRKGSRPRCPSCAKPLSAKAATFYIESERSGHEKRLAVAGELERNLLHRHRKERSSR
jgi:hypothetical protein